MIFYVSNIHFWHKNTCKKFVKQEIWFFCINETWKKKYENQRVCYYNKSTFIYFLNEQVVNEVIARNMRATSFTKMWADNYRVTFCFDTPWVVVCLFYTDHWHFLTLILFLPFQNTFFTKHTIFIQCINVRTEIYVYLDLVRAMKGGHWQTVKNSQGVATYWSIFRNQFARLNVVRNILENCINSINQQKSSALTIFNEKCQNLLQKSWSSNALVSFLFHWLSHHLALTSDKCPHLQKSDLWKPQS